MISIATSGPQTIIILICHLPFLSVLSLIRYVICIQALLPLQMLLCQVEWILATKNRINGAHIKKANGWIYTLAQTVSLAISVSTVQDA